MGNPQVTPIIERRHAWGFMVWDPENGMVTRGQIILAQGFGQQGSGLVLGEITVASTATEAVEGTNAGNPTFGAIAVAAPAVAGAYTMRMQDATHFVVEDPGGVEIGHGVLGTAFSAGGLSFTATAGGTPCVAGDSFTLTPAAGSGKYAPFDPTANNGLEVAAAILGSEFKDTTNADQPAAALLGGPARVNASELIWGANVTTPQQQAVALAQLAKLGIKNT